MKETVLLAGMLLACAGGAHREVAQAGPAGGREPIFREVDLNPYGRVALDAPFALRDSSVASSVDANVYALVGGRGWSFADTDSILVTLDAARRVVSLQFIYRAAKDYGAAVAEYEDLLGAPVERAEADSAGVRIERAVWHDERTRFELRRATLSGSRQRVSSALSSRRPATSWAPGSNKRLPRSGPQQVPLRNALR